MYVVFPADTSFTVFDIETTGLDPAAGDRVVEVAAVRIEGGVLQETKTFSSFVNPQRPVSFEAGAVHHISDDDLRTAPPIEEVLPYFLAFADNSLLVAHNAEFDLGFLEAEKEGCWGYVEIPECLCTLCLSRSVQPKEYRHSLDIVALRLGFSLPSDRHRALPDVLLTARILLRLLEVGNIRSLQELRERAHPDLKSRSRSPRHLASLPRTPWQ